MADRLRTARAEAGFRSARAAALSLGLSPSTYAAHENGQNAFGPDVARRYAKAFGVTAAWLLTGEAEPLEKKGKAAPAPTPVVGEIAKGAWIEEAPDRTPTAFLPVIDDRTEDGAMVAYRVRDGSLGHLAPEGGFLICRALDPDAAPNDGALVVVERLRKAQGIVERTARRVSRHGGRTELVEADPAAGTAEPIRTGHGKDGIDTRIAAKVVWILRTP
ncbi:helix-turn-helix domain-containing protein [Rhodobium gokarnense]|uniref:SOS-response transcriptional repressor LexA n=1 Tax=Rhodobium gokarnense TaxID=364296 RepID=A0ABT3HAG1_9HYPH|nr:helix-turn-helix domain-containing protein [Rhodobium gokarnense]MCW2307389.1 SOS-response transcriptional repressor LexA [Rhodobium gokarnense]